MNYREKYKNLHSKEKPALREVVNRSVSEDELEFEDHVTLSPKNNSYEEVIAPMPILPKKESIANSSSVPKEENVENINQKDKKVGKTVYIGFIIDGTLSFTTVYPKVYYILEELFNALDSTKRKFRGVDLQYSLEILHDNPEPVEFSMGSYFTASISKLKNNLETMEFYGGSYDGRENLKEAINQELLILNSVGNGENAYRGLIMITDALPKEEDLCPDFTSNEPGRYGEYTNYGLRFADIFAYSKEFTPCLRMVDQYGNTVENDRNNRVYYNSIQDLLKSDTDAISKQIQTMVDTICSQASVN